jgi:disulfide bond formation protein DsbB
MPAQRWAWLLLALSALSLELAALFFQYGLKLQPCVMCVYERTATMGVMTAGLLGAIAPRFALCRWSGFGLWAISAIWGLKLALEHTDLQINPSPFKTCDFFPQYPQWFNLDDWFPVFFKPSGDCGQVDWMFFGWSMPQWLIVCFSVYLVLFFIVALVAILGKKECCR